MENPSVPVANPPRSGPVSPSTPEESSQPGVVIRMKGRPRLTWLDSCLLGRGERHDYRAQGPTRFLSQTGDEKPESNWSVVFVVLLPWFFFRCYLRLLEGHLGPGLLLLLSWPGLELAGAAVKSPAPA